MKKLIAIFLAALMVFSVAFVAVSAEELPAETTTIVEEDTTRNIQNADGLVVPINFNQLKSSVIFKLFEKIIKFIMSLFGADAGAVDQEAATAVQDIIDAASEAASEAMSYIDANQ